MSRFKIGDKFSFVRKSAGTDRVVEVINTGTILSEGFVVEDKDHYQVKWDKEYGSNTVSGLLCDVESLKYGYRKIKN